MSFGIVLTRMPLRNIEDQCQETHCRDLRKDRCTQIVQGIGPVLDLLNPGLPLEEPRVQQRGMIDKCQLAWDWL
jgi:hypothetical protein